MAEFVIHVPEIDSEGKQFCFAIESTWLSSVFEATDLRADPEAKNGSMDLFVQRSGDDILVTGKVEARIFADCVRCLEDALVEVVADLGSLFSARAEGDRPRDADLDDLDLTPDELARESFTGDDIVLDDIVREHIILEVPMQPLCREDCPGIAVPAHVRPPADFGETKDADGVDPRLSGLKDLADQMLREEE